MEIIKATVGERKKKTKGQHEGNGYREGHHKKIDHKRFPKLAESSALSGRLTDPKRVVASGLDMDIDLAMSLSPSLWLFRVTLLVGYWRGRMM